MTFIFARGIIGNIFIGLIIYFRRLEDLQFQLYYKSRNISWRGTPICVSITHGLLRVSGSIRYIINFEKTEETDKDQVIDGNGLLMTTNRLDTSDKFI